MFALLRRRALVSYQAKYKDGTVKGCAIVYSHNLAVCVEKLKQWEKQASGKVPEKIIITARSPY